MSHDVHFVLSQEEGALVCFHLRRRKLDVLVVDKIHQNPRKQPRYLNLCERSSYNCTAGNRPVKQSCAQDNLLKTKVMKDDKYNFIHKQPLDAAIAQSRCEGRFSLGGADPE